MDQTDNNFDSGLQPVSTSASWQKLFTLTLRGAACLLKIKTAGNTIGHLKLTQGAIDQDPDPMDLAVDTDLNSPALSNLAYTLPAAISFPLPIGTIIQTRVQGGAFEIAVWASTAGGAGATVRVQGDAEHKKIG